MKGVFSGQLNNEADTVQLGQILAQFVDAPAVIYLEGGLGGGKTTLSRGFINAKGHQGKVKSPTYTLVEPYEMGHVRIYHFDLYRLSDPEELYFLGLEDYFGGDTICLVEWPERANGNIPAADFKIVFDYNSLGRSINVYCKASLNASRLQLMLGKVFESK